jgi:hypothetical protein
MKFNGISPRGDYETIRQKFYAVQNCDYIPCCFFCFRRIRKTLTDRPQDRLFQGGTGRMEKEGHQICRKQFPAVFLSEA